MEYREKTINELSDAEWNVWNNVVAHQADFDSPFFHPQFVRSVADVREDVRVAVIENEGDPVGFFPYQKHQRSIQPVAGRLSECHGVIAKEGIEWSPLKLLTACGVRSWHFDHLPDSQSEFKEYSWGVHASPFLDLRNGFESYRNNKKKSGSLISQTDRKMRKFEREVGPIRFDWHNPSQEVFDKLAAWKTAQHQRTAVLEIFKYPWVNKLVQRMSENSQPDFRCPFSALYAGERIVAVHLGLASRTNFHMWMPAYDIEFAKYSPGLILLMHLLPEAEAHGITCVDFGPGEERYKQEFKTGDRVIHEGMIGHNFLEVRSRAFWYRTKRTMRTSRYRSVLEVPLKISRRLRQRLAFR